MTSLVALQTCDGCGGRVALGLMRCGRCQTVTAMFAQQMKERSMPRITVAGGPTNPAAGPGETGYIEPEAVSAQREMRGEDGPEIELPEGKLVALPDGLVPVLRDYSSMTLVELRKHAGARGLPTSGSKSALLERLGPGGVGHFVPASEAEEVSA